MSSPEFVGREPELERIAANWAAVQGGHGRLVVISGEAGIGKTRLLEEWSKRLVRDGQRVVLGHCIDVDVGTLPYEPFIGIIRPLLRDVPFDVRRQLTEPASEALNALVPDLVPAPMEPLSRQTDRLGTARLHRAVLSIIATAVDRGPMCVVIEDIQWMDHASHALLKHIARSVAELPILVLLSVRSDELHARHPMAASIAELRRLTVAESIVVPAFDPREVRALIASIVGHDVATTLGDQIHATSDGNPFFVEELVAMGLTSNPAMSAGLRDLLLSQVATAPADVRTILSAAAIGEHALTEELLAAVVGWPPRRIAGAIRRAVESHFLIALDAEWTSLAFRHALVREAVRNDLMPSERRRWHQAWAGALIPGDRGMAGVVAMHWEQAGRPDLAVPLHLQAAEGASRQQAHGAAAFHYRSASSLIANGDRSAGLGRTPVELLELAAREFEDAGDRDAAIECLQDAGRRLQVELDPRLATRVWTRLAELAVGRAQGGLAQRALDAAMASAELAGGDEGAIALAVVAMNLGLKGDLDGSRATAERALVLARSAGAACAQSRALRALAILTAMDDVDAGVDALREAATLAASCSDIDERFQILTDIPWALGNAGRYREALVATDESYAAAESAGVSGALHRVYLARRIDYLMALGRWTEAEAHIEPARMSGAWTARFSGAVLYARMGRPGAAEALIAEALDLVPFDDPAVPDRGHLALARVNLQLAQGRFEEAIETAAEASPLPGERDIESELGLLAALACGSLVDRARSASAASTWVQAAEAIVERLRVLADVPDKAPCRAARARHITGLAELGRIRRTNEPTTWARSRTLWSELDVPERAALSGYREAEAILVAGRSNGRPRATDALRDAYAIVQELGAAPLRQEIEALAATTRLSLERKDEHDARPTTHRGSLAVDALTEREREVLRLVVEGSTNRQIGEALFISPKTAGVHISNILGKLGAANRVEAATIAHRRGID